MKYIPLLALPALACAAMAAETVEFNRDVRPILSDKCFTCHGPDPANRKSQVRFDVESSVFADLGGRFAIVPGDPAKSELIRRITSENKALRMPPVYSDRTLTAREIDVLRRWVEQGAKWQKHWSLIPPSRPTSPQISRPEWARNGIDNFIFDRLAKEGLTPSPEADRARLIRRVSLDLTGLPPTLAEVDAFLNDTSANAYEKVVDRLLASPRYGERMAARWLDAARYADTNGYQTDGERYMWRWRDWVIESFNRNEPFDQFTIEQIAGDLLPNATLSQKIATGFNRNHRGNGEGGIVPEEYAVEYVVDRIETTSTVWLGLTLGCTRCHSHKYDPFTQKEFYQLFAYFNNIPEKGKAWKYGNSPPLITAPNEAQQVQLRAAEEKLAAAESTFAKLQPDLIKAQRAWEKSLKDAEEIHWTMQAGLAWSDELTGDNRKFDGQRFVNAGNVANFGFYDKFTLSAWIVPASLEGAILTRAEDVAEGEGLGLYLKDGKLQVNLVKRWLDDALRIETESTLERGRAYHVMMTYDGSRVADGIKVYVNGVPQKLKYVLDDLNQSFNVKEPFRVGAGGGPEMRFRGEIYNASVYKTAFSPADAAMLAADAPITTIAAVAPEKRTPAESDKISRCFLETAAPANIRQAREQLVALRTQRRALVDSFPTVMVMEERPTPRDTFLLQRGAYDRPGEKVTRGVPAALHPLPAGAANNRLGLAKWLVDRNNPLTARVTVNRFWQMYFGTGLVKTVEDFGSQGEAPSHPELLDYLATQFMDSGWDLKALQRLIVTSATYRQSSKIRPELLQKDPENRLLARGPRLRLSAEMMRDQALVVSGLMVGKIGGPSVKPYQPAGLWKELSGGEDYKPDKGEGLYRRSLYTFWKRTAPPPSMANFDSALRETCTVREVRTNTPLQALDLMNDFTYLEASRVLAERMMKEGGNTPADRVAYGFRLATARRPAPAKSQVLLDSFFRTLDSYQTNPEAAVKLLAAGEHPRDPALNASELAAYTTVASLIFNLDETVTKE